MLRNVILTAFVLALACGSATGEEYMVVVAQVDGGGISRFGLEGTGPLQPWPSIPPEAVNDPAAVAFSSRGELFVGNRHWNNGPASISRFRFDPSGNFEFVETITGNGLSSIHGLAFSPDGELFACNTILLGTYGTTVSRFRSDASGGLIPNGQFSTPPSPFDVAVSPGYEVFLVNYSGTVHRYRLNPGSGEITPNGSFVVPGAELLVGLAISPSGELFAADHADHKPGTVYRYLFDAAGAPIANGTIAGMVDPVCLAFSPEGELFVASHDEGTVHRFLFDSSGQPIPNGIFSVPGAFGVAVLDMAVLRQVGDLNCDGHVDFDDINPFVMALISHSGYEAAYPECWYDNGDCNRDGYVDFDDINPFVECLVAGGCPQPTGACCEADGTCNLTTLADCTTGTWHGEWTSCTPNPCPPIPPGMVLIPAGEFLMGNSFSPGEGYSDELPRHAVYVDAFYMDTYEVTNQQYAAALNWAYAQGGLITVTSGVVYQAASGTSYPYCDTTTSSSYSRITWNGTTFGVTSGKGNHPMVRVSWYGAAAYANWRSGMEGKPLCYDLSTWTCNFGASGYRLPTEAEWEKAARGGAAGRRFPWSDTDTIQHARANYYSDSYYSYDTSPTRGDHPTFNTGVYPYTSPVGYFAPNGYGLYDMAGNAWEWCNDWYGGTYYSSSAYDNPHGPTSGSYRVLRGGGWYANAYYCRAAYRNNLVTPDGRVHYLGFRCAVGTP